ncbi:MAG: hypothetical protein JWM68_4968 [Verrucomicrobiales bacterium]|nr:hypothetical protein [Verrucomicrobiales bacterium]
MERNPRKKKPVKKEKSSLPGQEVTWANVKRHGDFMYIMLTKNGKAAAPLPFGQQPTANINLKCDEFFGQLFKADRVPTKMPSEIAPWIMARLIVTMAMVNTAAANDAPPPKARTIQDVLFEMTVKDWNDCMFLLWSAFAPTPDGKGAMLKMANFGKGLDIKRFSEN